MPRKLFNKDQDLKIKKLYLSGLTMSEIAHKFNCYKQPIRYSLKRSKVKIRKKWKRASGEKNARWKGGVRIIKKYIHISIPGHPLARNDGYVPLHRLLFSYKAERKISSEEVVNHIDGDTLNNHPNNLEVYKNNNEHMKLHAKEFKRDKFGKFLNKD